MKDKYLSMFDVLLFYIVTFSVIYIQDKILRVLLLIFYTIIDWKKLKNFQHKNNNQIVGINGLSILFATIPLIFKVKIAIIYYYIVNTLLVTSQIYKHLKISYSEKLINVNQENSIIFTDHVSIIFVSYIVLDGYLDMLYSFQSIPDQLSLVLTILLTSIGMVELGIGGKIIYKISKSVPVTP